MSDIGSHFFDDDVVDEERPVAPRRDRRRRRRKGKKRGRSFLAVLLSLAIVGGIGYGVFVGGSRALDAVTGFFGPAEDYPGPGSGEVTVTIAAGATLADMGSTLEDANVVASGDAFVEAANENPDGSGIQPGDYVLKKKMKAADAVTAMVEAMQILGQAGVGEGLRVSQIVEQLAEKTDFTEKELNAAIKDVELPDYAKGEPEGFLFPATYDLKGDTTAASLMQSVIDRFKQAASDVDLEAGAKERDMTIREVVTVASLIQREAGRSQDMPKVAEVIYNRISGKCASVGVGSGRLEMDSTIHYALNDYGTVATTTKQRQIESPYNTYTNGGLPPGPIASPEEAALEAALNPSDDGWCYFVTINLESKDTRFARTHEAHNVNVGRLQTYCRTSDLC